MIDEEIIKEMCFDLRARLRPDWKPEEDIFEDSVAFIRELLSAVPYTVLTEALNEQDWSTAADVLPLYAVKVLANGNFEWWDSYFQQAAEEATKRARDGQRRSQGRRLPGVLQAWILEAERSIGEEATDKQISDWIDEKYRSRYEPSKIKRSRERWKARERAREQPPP